MHRTSPGYNEILNGEMSIFWEAPIATVAVYVTTPPEMVEEATLLLRVDWPAVMVTPPSAVVPFHGVNEANVVVGFRMSLNITHPAGRGDLLAEMATWRK